MIRRCLQLYSSMNVDSYQNYVRKQHKQEIMSDMNLVPGHSSSFLLTLKFITGRNENFLVGWFTVL